MALNRIQRDGIQDDAIDATKIEDGTVAGQDIVDGAITNTQINTSAAIAIAKISGLGTAAVLDHGTAANKIVKLDSNSKLPAVNASLLTNLDAADIIPGGTLPVISGGALTGIVTDTSAMENNIAILAFKVQSANDLAKFNLVDQVVDEYKDDTGLGTQTDVDRSGSTAADGYIATNPAGNTTGTLISTANTALTSPATGDIVMLIENFIGTTTLGTDLKAFVSRNGGTNWYEATGDYALTDVGSWGSGTKKIITANGIPFAGPAGTDMRYKIEWAGQSYTAAGTALWVCGKGNNGELGNGGAANISSLVQIGSLTDWANIASGSYHGQAVKSDGTLWSWGVGNHGQLGLGNTTSYSSPVQVGALTNWSQQRTQLSSGPWSCGAIKTDGTLWTWGKNSDGRLGLGDTTNRSSPTQVGSLTDWSAMVLPEVWSDQMVAVKTNGTLWTWGRNNVGQLGHGDTTNRSSPVLVGNAGDNMWTSKIDGSGGTVAAIRSDKSLWVWGGDYESALGLGTTDTHKSSPTQVGSQYDWAEISVGAGARGAAIKTNGTLWTWGRNGDGESGLGDTTNRSLPTQVGTDTNWSIVRGNSFSVFAIKTDGTLWAWGRNDKGQLGQGNTTSYSSPVQVGSGTNWNQVDCGENTVVAGQSILEAGEVARVHATALAWA